MSKEKIGLTTTIPVEIIFAANRTPVDLNNIFINDPESSELVLFAEKNGFPQSACAWTKGLYGTIHKYGIKEVVGVMQGDCSETLVLCEILKSEGIKIYPFCYPVSRQKEDLKEQLDRFANQLGTNIEKAEEWKNKLDQIRKISKKIFDLAQDGRLESLKLFVTLLNTSDFFGDPEYCKRKLLETLEEAEKCQPNNKKIRLSCAGVPTILTDIWEIFEQRNARFLDYEVPRQFALLNCIDKNLVETYLKYNYPYDIFSRIDDVNNIIQERKIQGLIHYVQSFCHRQMEDRLWREKIEVPILTIEADKPGKVDERTKTRIEAFFERLN